MARDKERMNSEFIQLLTFNFLYGLFIEQFCIIRPGVPLEAAETAKQLSKN
jgi:hypothetical protein